MRREPSRWSGTQTRNVTSASDAPSARRASSRGWRRRAGVLALAFGALAPLSCQSTSANAQWSFCVTRECYKDGSWIEALGNSSSSSCSDSGGAVVLLALVLLPVAIDIAILPVTGVHDVCQAR